MLDVQEAAAGHGISELHSRQRKGRVCSTHVNVEEASFLLDCWLAWKAAALEFSGGIANRFEDLALRIAQLDIAFFGSVFQFFLLCYIIGLEPIRHLGSYLI